jgi:hypothetical protein
MGQRSIFLTGVAIGFFYFALTINLEWGIAIGILTFAF